MPRLRSWLLVMLMVVLAVVWWRALAWYPRLPDRFPVHFDLGGTPDRWAAKTPAAWFVLPAVATILAASMAVVGLWLIPLLARRTPQLVNLPNKERFLTLDADLRAEAVAPVGSFMLFEAVLMGGLFLWIVEISGRVATGQATAAKPWPVAIVLAATTMGVPAMLLALMRSVDNAAKRGPATAQSSTSTPLA